MIIRCIFIVAIAYAQIPPQPPVTTSSACLNGCFEEGSLVFAANNLRNFEKVVVNIEQFCNAHEQLVKCSASCSDEDREDLKRRIALSEYICKDKIEEFRLAKECVQSQETETVNQCSTDCGNPPDAGIQLDSSPSAAVNPFAFFDSITPICRTIECIVKCAITESNKKCAGTGDLFRDIGFKQVLEASEHLRNDLDNSSSPVAGQLAKIYLEALPESCSYIVDPVKYDTLFADHTDDLGSEMPTETASVDGVTAKGLPENGAPVTVKLEGFLNDATTRIFHLEIEPVTTAMPTEITEATNQNQESAATSQPEATTNEFKIEPANEPELPVGPPSSGPAESEPKEVDHSIAQPESPIQIQFQPIPSQSGVEHIPEQEEAGSNPIISASTEANKIISTTDAAVTVSLDGTLSESPKDETEEDKDEISSTPDIAAATVSSEVERTIMVVNDDNDEIEDNEVRSRPQPMQRQKTNDAPKWISMRLLTVIFALMTAF